MKTLFLFLLGVAVGSAFVFCGSADKKSTASPVVSQLINNKAAQPTG